MSTNELTAKIEELREYKTMKEELEEMIAAIETEIKTAMGESEEMYVGRYHVRWTKITSVRFDTSAFRKEQPDMYMQFARATESRRFSIG